MLGPTLSGGDPKTMPEKELSREYIYKGDSYGPGTVEVPDSVLNAEDLSSVFRADLDGNPDEADPRDVGTPDVRDQPQTENLDAAVLTAARKNAENFPVGEDENELRAGARPTPREKSRRKARADASDDQASNDAPETPSNAGAGKASK